jgi:hypothetical protein
MTMTPARSTGSRRASSLWGCRSSLTHTREWSARRPGYDNGGYVSAELHTRRCITRLAAENGERLCVLGSHYWLASSAHSGLASLQEHPAIHPSKEDVEVNLLPPPLDGVPWLNVIFAGPLSVKPGQTIFQLCTHSSALSSSSPYSGLWDASLFGDTLPRPLYPPSLVLSLSLEYPFYQASACADCMLLSQKC